MPHSSKRLETTPGGRQPERSSSSRNPAPNDNAGRRDENSISFRHFLQPHSDVVPTTTTRHGRTTRGTSSGSVDLVDGVPGMGLPDFVQDHLVLESLAASSSPSTGGGIPNSSSHNNNGGPVNHEQGSGGATSSAQHHAIGGASALDMSVLSAILPDFTTSQRNQSCLSKRSSGHRKQENVVNNGEGACASSSPSPSSHSKGPVALPDFLSDGPMLCGSNNSNISDGIHHNNSSSTSSPNRSGAVGVGTSASSLRENSLRDSDLTASQQIDRLRRELAEKNRRLSQLESDFSAARNEASMFETAYLSAQQNLEAANRRASIAEAQVAKLKDQLNAENPTRRRDNCNDPSTSTPTNSHYAAIDVAALATIHNYLTESLKQLQKVYPSGNIPLDENKEEKKDEMKSSKQ